MVESGVWRARPFTHSPPTPPHPIHTHTPPPPGFGDGREVPKGVDGVVAGRAPLLEDSVHVVTELGVGREGGSVCVW